MRRAVWVALAAAVIAAGVCWAAAGRQDALAALAGGGLAVLNVRLQQVYTRVVLGRRGGVFSPFFAFKTGLLLGTVVLFLTVFDMSAVGLMVGFTVALFAALGALFWMYRNGTQEER